LREYGTHDKEEVEKEGRLTRVTGKRERAWGGIVRKARKMSPGCKRRRRKKAGGNN